MPKTISTAQQLFLNLLAASDPIPQAQDLVNALDQNTDLWVSVFPVRELDFVAFQKLPDSVHLDSVFFVAEPGRQNELEELVSHFDPDELDWLSSEEAIEKIGFAYSVHDRTVLRAFWD